MLAPTLDARLAVRAKPNDQYLVMHQSWRDLLFLHWVYEAAVIQRTLPKGLQVDTFDGQAYLGVVPFFMNDVRPRFCPAVPGISNFMELNLRTYVFDAQGRPGVWFYSLDANQWLAVKLARLFFKLPYFYATMTARRTNSSIDYRCRRRGADASLASRFQYRPTGALFQAQPGTLEFFLVERYLLFAHAPRSDRIWSGQVHHDPYPLCAAEVADWDEHLLVLDGFEPPGRPPDHILMSPGVDVDIFGLSR